MKRSSTDSRLTAIERVCKAVADKTRLRILGLLARGETCVCHIHETLGIPQPTASRHLAYLRRAGLVKARKDGQWVHYRVARLADPVPEALLAAVTHCLTHLKVTKQDQHRLDVALGCCTPAVAHTDVSLPCCTPVTIRESSA
jgi:ArsR family transcriptional regulator